MREAPCLIPQVSRQRYRAPRADDPHAKQNSRPHGAVIRVFNEPGNVIETHEHAGDFKEPLASVATKPEFYLKLVRLMLQNRARIALR